MFVHGFLCDGTIWRRTAVLLAEQGIRSYAPDWPLGSHPIALKPEADQSPRGIARHVNSFLEAMDLEDVTLVGNDSGGAICQFLLDSDASRVGRLVLTNCDAFDKFPPVPFGTLRVLAPNAEQPWPAIAAGAASVKVRPRRGDPAVPHHRADRPWSKPSSRRRALTRPVAVALRPGVHAVRDLLGAHRVRRAGRYSI